MGNVTFGKPLPNYHNLVVVFIFLLIIFLLFSFFITKRSESYITWAEAGQEKEGLKETICTFPHRRPRTARSQPSGEAGEESAGDSWNRTGGPFSAGQRSAERGEEEGDSEERETRQGAAERGAKAWRGKQNQNKEDSGSKTRRGTSSLSHCILEWLLQL